MLPKKKDFIKRARDEEAKRNRIRDFKRKALTKNEDEFYFAMQNSTLSVRILLYEYNFRFKADKGHIPLNNTKDYSDAELTDMLSHDLLYLQRELTTEMSKIRSLESRLNLLPGDPSVTNKRLRPKRIVFVESIKEARAVKASFDPSVVPTQIPSTLPAAIAEEIMDAQAAGYRELSERLARADKLKLAIKRREAKNILIVIILESILNS